MQEPGVIAIVLKVQKRWELSDALQFKSKQRKCRTHRCRGTGFVVYVTKQKKPDVLDVVCRKAGNSTKAEQEILKKVGKKTQGRGETAVLIKTEHPVAEI